MTIENPFMPTPPEQQRISELSRELRLRNGLTQAEAAKATGLQGQTISRIEEGRQPLSAISSIELLKDLAVTEEDWMEIHKLISDVPSLQNEWESRKSMAEKGYYITLPDMAIKIERISRTKDGE